jgi:hypothetical protein
MLDVVPLIGRDDTPRGRMLDHARSECYNPAAWARFVRLMQQRPHRLEA